jgi:RHS repeat-associated protein
LPIATLGLEGLSLTRIIIQHNNGQVWFDRFATSATISPATITSFTSSLPSPQAAGVPITWTASAAGSVQPLQFRFERQDEGLWSVVQPYGTSNTYSWTPTSAEAGDHSVRVSVRNAGSLADFDDTESLPMTIAASSGNLIYPHPSLVERLRRLFRIEPRVPAALGVTYPPVMGTSAPEEHRYSLYTPELNLLAETASTSSSSTPIAYEYIWFAGQPLAQLDVASSTVDYYFNDHLGTPILQTSASSTVTWRAEYEPYGTIRTFRAGGENHQPLRFPGQESADGDSESYNIFRWYRAGWGRYTESDPIGLSGGLNLFSYAESNPVIHTDFFGLKTGPGDQIGPFRINVQVCCQPVSGWVGYVGGVHCSIFVDSLGSQWAGFELMPNPRERLSKGFPVGTTDPPGGQCRSTGGDCPLLKCVAEAYKSYPGGGSYDGYNGPNSNTFVRYVAETCNLNVPRAAVESYGYWANYPAPPKTRVTPPGPPALPSCCGGPK